MYLTPYLALVLAGFAIFILVLGSAWARQALDERRARRRAVAARPARGDTPTLRPRRAA